MIERKIKTCTKCHKTKPLNEFHNDKSRKDGKNSQCKECNRRKCKKYNKEHKEEKAEYDKEYYQEHKGEVNKRSRDYYEEVGRRKYGHLSMYENKFCASYLGVAIAERLCRHLFKDIEVMPYGNPKFDFICNKGKKIDVKSSCTRLRDKKHQYWKFNINCNVIADFFIFIAFDNVEDLNPLYLWMIPGHKINDKASKSIRLTTIHKWDEWKMDIKDAQTCCAEMKASEIKLQEIKI